MWSPWLLLLISLVGGTILDPAPERGLTMRDGLRLLRADFHIHTRFGDGVLTPMEVVLVARRHGLDAIAVTEHNQIFPARIAAWFSGLIGGPTVIIGEEITTHPYHIVALGLKSRVDWRHPLRAAIDHVHRQGGVVIAAHPDAKHWPALRPVVDLLDGVEVINPLYHRELLGSAHESRAMLEFYRRARARKPDIAPIASSDYHFFKAMGGTYTWVFAQNDSADAIIDAVRRGHTVVETDHGRRFGPAKLAASLAAAKPARPAEPSYSATSAADALFRVLGWLSLVALLLLRDPFLNFGTTNAERRTLTRRR